MISQREKGRLFAALHEEPGVFIMLLPRETKDWVIISSARQLSLMLSGGHRDPDNSCNSSEKVRP